MSIASTVARIPGATGIPGLADAWTWSVGGGWFRFDLVVDGGHAFQMTSREAHSAQLSRDVLEFARRNGSRLERAVPFAVIEGFSSPGSGFDSVAAVLPSVARLHEAEHPELTPVTYAIFPAWRCEFSGEESEDEAITRYARMIDTADINRDPMPFLRMSYAIPGKGMHSVGDKRGLAAPDSLYTTIEDLAGQSKGHIECENYRGRVRRIEWTDEGPVLTGDGRRPVPQDELAAWAHRFLTGDEEA